jgi:hypothetical protein
MRRILAVLGLIGGAVAGCVFFLWWLVLLLLALGAVGVMFHERFLTVVSRKNASARKSS